SFKRSASSSAKLSGSFISKPMSDSLIQFPAMARGASLAGTCLIQTMIFTGVPCDFKTPAGNPAFLGTSRRYKNLLLARPALENERGVRSAEAERVPERVVHIRFARDVGHVVQIALRIGMKLIYGRRQDLVAQSQRADACLQTARAAKQVAGHGFRGADGKFLARRPFTEKPFHRGGFDDVADRRRSTVGVDVADIVGGKLGVFKSRAHDAERAVAVFDGLRDVVRVAGHAIADDFGNDRGIAFRRVFERLEDQNARALADDETIAVDVKRPAGGGRIVVARG